MAHAKSHGMLKLYYQRAEREDKLDPPPQQPRGGATARRHIVGYRAARTRARHLISTGDLRAANGLKPEQDMRLPAGLILLVPQRSDDHLQVRDGTTHLDFNRLDGSFKLKLDMENGQTKQFVRQRDDGRQCFYDIYSEQDNNGETHNLQRLEVDSGYRARIQAAFQRIPGYYPVPPQAYRDFLAAASKGRFLNQSIKGVYVYSRLD